MLSGETEAAGKYPVEVVETVARIAYRAEQALPYADILRRKRTRENPSVTDAISYATCATASNLGASAIITATRTGQTARMVAIPSPGGNSSRHPDEKTVRKLALVWGSIRY